MREDGWTLSVADSGVGRGEPSPGRRVGLGTSVVAALARQLGAEVHPQRPHAGLHDVAGQHPAARRCRRDRRPPLASRPRSANLRRLSAWSELRCSEFGCWPRASRRRSSRFGPAAAAPEPDAHDYVIKDFRFRSGETLPELKLHYYTLGQPKTDAAGKITNAVLILHGTGGTGRQFLSPQFADVLFVPGGLLDPAKYFIILPDGIGHGGSSKPSDGLRDGLPALRLRRHGRGPARAGHQGAGRREAAAGHGHVHGLHARLRVGRGLSGRRPGADAARLPAVEIAGRNRLWRKMAIDAIKSDPAWKGGDYTAQPVQGLRTAESLLILAGAVAAADAARHADGRGRSTPGPRPSCRKRMASRRRQRHDLPGRRLADLRPVARTWRRSPSRSPG